MKSKIQKKEKSMAEPIFIPLKNYIIYSEDEIKKRSKDFYELVKKRRTIRSFSKEKVSLEIMRLVSVMRVSDSLHLFFFLSSVVKPV